MVLGHSDALAAIRKKSRLQLVCYSAHWEICVTQNEEVSKRQFFCRCRRRSGRTQARLLRPWTSRNTMAQCEGTIARMLMHLLGSNIYCGPSLGQLSNTFGTAGPIGKKIAMAHGSTTPQFAPLSQRSS